MFALKQANETIASIDRFLNLVDEGGILFLEGVKNYLSGNSVHFQENVKSLSGFENEADTIKRIVANILYTQSLMPQLRSDILKLLEDLDNMLDIAKSSLVQFDIEQPFIPDVLKADMVMLAEMSSKSVQSVIPGARHYFRNPDLVKESLHRVYLYEKEADRIGEYIKRRVFHEMPEIQDLAKKFHIRFFTSNIEALSDAAEKAADLLLIMAVKRTI